MRISFACGNTLKESRVLKINARTTKSSIYFVLFTASIGINHTTNSTTTDKKQCMTTNHTTERYTLLLYKVINSSILNKYTNSFRSVNWCIKKQWILFTNSFIASLIIAMRTLGWITHEQTLTHKYFTSIRNRNPQFPSFENVSNKIVWNCVYLNASYINKCAYRCYALVTHLSFSKIKHKHSNTSLTRTSTNRRLCYVLICTHWHWNVAVVSSATVCVHEVVCAE